MFRCRMRSSSNWSLQTMKLWVADSWKLFRPYAVHLTKDFLISSYVWVLVFLYGLLRTHFPVSDWVAKFISQLHGVFVVLTYLLFFMLSVFDIRKLIRRAQ